MKKILFPFELNNPIYKEAYIYAVKFARKNHAELIMLNVFNFEIDNRITKESYNQKVKANWLKAYTEAFKLNENFLKNHNKANDELKIKFDNRFVYGDQLNIIRKILKEEVIDLIVLPVSDLNEFNKKQLELIRDDLFEKNNASLLAVPAQKEYSSLKNILFATDLKKLNLHELYFNDLLKVAESFKSNIHFLHVSNKEDAFLPKDIEIYRTMMQIIKANSKHRFESMYGKDVTESINQYILANEVDLVVMVKHEHFFLDSLFHDSVSEKMVLSSKVPVLIMREKDDD